MSTEDEKPKNLIEEILDKLGALVTAAFGLVAALAWNEAIQTIFIELFGAQKQVLPMLIYAATVTIIHCCCYIGYSKGDFKNKRKIIKVWAQTLIHIFYT